MASHYDFYETMNDSLMHNHAPSFPQHEGGDSWQGALCPRHKPVLAQDTACGARIRPARRSAASAISNFSHGRRWRKEDR